METIASIGPIVCGVDGSDASVRTACLAADLAGGLETRLLLVHAVDGVRTATSTMGARQGAARGALREVAATVLRGTGAAQLRMAPNLVLEYGSPARRLAEVAERVSAQMLVVGSRGRGRTGRAFLGSVASDLLQSATGPLVVVPARRRADA